MLQEIRKDIQIKVPFEWSRYLNIKGFSNAQKRTLRFFHIHAYEWIDGCEPFLNVGTYAGHYKNFFILFVYFFNYQVDRLLKTYWFKQQTIKRWHLIKQHFEDYGNWFENSSGQIVKLSELKGVHWKNSGQAELLINYSERSESKIPKFVFLLLLRNHPPF